MTTNLKESGLSNKYAVTKLTNPDKAVEAIVLDFDDPIARTGILAWAREMNRHGYTKVYDDVIAKLDTTKTPRLHVSRRRFTPELKAKAIELAATQGVSRASRLVGIAPRLLFSWRSKAVNSKNRAMTALR